MTAETINLVLNRFLESLQDKERDDERGKTNADAEHSDLVDSR